VTKERILDRLCQYTLEQQTNFVVTNASVNRSLQAIFVAYEWKPGQQILPSKAASGGITALNTELVAI